MPYNKRLLVRDFLIWGFFFLFLVFYFGDTMRSQVAFQYKTIKAYIDNFFSLHNPKISRLPRPAQPVSQEIRLASSFGEPFVSFQPAEWEEFWEIVYGLYPVGEPEEPGLPNTMRQLSQEELKVELEEKYEMPFVNFKKKHWEAFFSLVFD
jgi:hypothetical protein